MCMGFVLTNILGSKLGSSNKNSNFRPRGGLSLAIAKGHIAQLVDIS